MIEKKDIENLFAKWLDQISDKSLRDKVVEVWFQGCKQGHWDTIEKLKTMPFTLATDHKNVSFINHTQAVTEGAIQLARAQLDNYEKLPYQIDMDRLIAGGLLHDVGKLVEIEPDGDGAWKMSDIGRCMRHPVYGLTMAKEAGLDDKILNVIGCHAKEGEGASQVVETILVHQADFATFNPLVMKKGGKLIE
jgi:putative nucleotidyltransferase with HDIG domain